MSIPRIIHQTWRDCNLPDDYALYQASVRDQHPDWDYCFWTDEDLRGLIVKEYPWFLPTYDSYSHNIERVDAARYFILLSRGGIYLDLDMECLKPLDELFTRPDRPYFGMLALPSIDDSIVGNAFMAAPAGHAFFAFLTKRLAPIRQRDVTHQDVFNNTGPNMLARQLAAFSAIGKYEIVGLDKICDRGALGDHPTLKHFDLETIRRQRRLFLIHHHSNSWNVQHAPPDTVPGGYSLHIGADIQGHDLAYVEYAPGDYQMIADRCDALSEAVAFNYNGYIKSGGTVEEVSAEGNDWLKPGMVPWVCVRSAT